MAQEKHADYEQLEMLRAKMVTAAEQHGLAHPLVMHYSRQIDTRHSNMMKTKPDNPDVAPIG
ncbi:hypothetical protein JCM19037_3775 [Geomicrobium sp. JCM 19037]|uniref:Spo0E family sporulation regulatory protein-aspartic acid phosphatase n=1 Tax=unclassified Geomicrobium TaxID=2628951 RepID=UPI00045F1CA9|nr:MULTISPECIES: Spo0E family sporulation regulatory protein-aspartic acid phosphatase [unclassified Geomicrobium]GAK05291.1 hypothetical protein JCM19037_3775 [Geomicrobium sp. JCM 19037]GAK13737.1 hypothetical protein JCM19039_3604 [Geomicrobium sp. JCM 19039]